MTAQGGKLNLARAATSPELAARRAVRAACFGFFVDMFDVYLPIAVLAPALAYFIPAGLSGTTRATFFYVVFAITLIGRPLGALMFGSFGDLLGRRQTTLASVAGLSVVTLLMALLPGYEASGGFGVAALIVLRFLDGIFSGGAYTAANPLAMEYSPKDKRGLYGALIHVGYPAALLCTSLLTALIMTIAPGGDASSPYALGVGELHSSVERCSQAHSLSITTGVYRNLNFGAPLRRAPRRSKSCFPGLIYGVSGDF
jgi:MFS family permease